MGNQNHEDTKWVIDNQNHEDTKWVIRIMKIPNG